MMVGLVIGKKKQGPPSYGESTKKKGFPKEMEMEGEEPMEGEEKPRGAVGSFSCPKCGHSCDLYADSAEESEE